VTNTVSNSSRFYPGIITLLLTLPTVRNLNGSGKEMGDEQSSLDHCRYWTNTCCEFQVSKLIACVLWCHLTEIIRSITFALFPNA